MRTTPEECREIARIVARKLNAATGPTVLYVPLGGVSMIATEGQVFHDPEADEALFSTLREELDTSKVEVHELELDVNDPAFALAMADRLHELCWTGGCRLWGAARPGGRPRLAGPGGCGGTMGSPPPPPALIDGRGGGARRLRAQIDRARP